MATNKEKDVYEEEEDEYPVYVPSESVNVAKDYLKQVKSSGYDRRWADRLSTLVDMYVNREDFEYSPEDDIVWQQAKGVALRDGKRAMDDTVARGAALSGGYANSYAVTAGAQAYERAVSDFAATADEYYDRAYERYLAEENSLLDEISLVAELDDEEYSRYMELLDDAQSRYDSEYSRDYSAWRDYISDKVYADELAYEREQDSLDREYKAWRDSVSDARYADETAYAREQDSLDREYKAWRDSVSDAQDQAELAYDYAKLTEDARQFDTKQNYDSLKAEYDAYVKQTEKEMSDAANAEKARAEREEKMANLKISPTYKKALDMLKLTSNKERGIRELYVNGKLGSGENAMMCLELLCGQFGISVNSVLE